MPRCGRRGRRGVRPRVAAGRRPRGPVAGAPPPPPSSAPCAGRPPARGGGGGAPLAPFAARPTHRIEGGPGAEARPGKSLPERGPGRDSPGPASAPSPGPREPSPRARLLRASEAPPPRPAQGVEPRAADGRRVGSVACCSLERSGCAAAHPRQARRGPPGAPAGPHAQARPRGGAARVPPGPPAPRPPRRQPAQGSLGRAGRAARREEERSARSARGGPCPARACRYAAAAASAGPGRPGSDQGSWGAAERGGRGGGSVLTGQRAVRTGGRAEPVLCGPRGRAERQARRQLCARRGRGR
jgi:hypothetical protein